MLDTIEVHTLDGATWTIKRYLTRRDRRLINAHVLDATIADLPALRKIEGSMEELMARVRTPTPTDGDRAVPSPYEDDALLVYGTVSWSYDKPLTGEAVLDVSEHVAAQVLAKMHELYDLKEEALKN